MSFSGPSSGGGLRLRRRRQKLIGDHPVPSQRVSAHCFTRSTPVHRLLSFFSLEYECLSLNEEVLHISSPSHPEKQAFIFHVLGTVVFWSMEVYEESVILDRLGELSPVYESSRIQSDDHSFIIAEKDSSFRIHRDVLYIPSHETDVLLYQLSCSYALAISVKLAVVEGEIESVVEQTKLVPTELSLNGRVSSMSRKEVSCMIGELFMHKASINLVYDMLDTPDFFWDLPDLERIYDLTRKYVVIDTRVQVLNLRLEVLNELLVILQSEKSESHGSTLEWIVIWLIVLEVALGLFEIFYSLLT